MNWKGVAAGFHRGQIRVILPEVFVDIRSPNLLC